MYIVRETFTAKPGMASRLAALFKEVAGMTPEYKMRILTDAVGPFNTVVLETEVAEFGEFEKMMKEYSQRTDVRDRLKGYADLYQSGRREIYVTV